jgi:hypothetical protein
MQAGFERQSAQHHRVLQVRTVRDSRIQARLRQNAECTPCTAASAVQAQLAATPTLSSVLQLAFDLIANLQIITACCRWLAC